MDLIFADKPAGFTTHSSLNDTDRKKPTIDPNDGFIELLSDRSGRALWPVHRLDRETVGAIAFALDRESANQARELFEGREVKKVYQFVTHRSASVDTLTVESHIEREGNAYVSRKDLPPNAKTVLTRLKTQGRYSLWEARPETGKPHQIRLHAQDSGISILGDELHGGAPFPTLCLASLSIELEGQTHRVAAPIWFEQLELLSDSLLVSWLASFDRRERWLNSLQILNPSARELGPTETYRWIHREGDPLRLETLGSVAWLSWFRDSDPDESEWSAIHKLLEIKGITTWYLQVRADRGRQPNRELVFASEPGPADFWTATENGLKFEFRRDSGLSPGLFLDQRRNRAWVRAEAKGLKVLNLFCYTSGFSVAAAAGGAVKTVSVDLSRTFLEWSKRNFTLNGLELKGPPEGHEFRAMDSREYLAWAKKKGITYDLVICDPPSFSRSDKGIFKIEKDFEALLLAALDVVAPKGRLLFSSNFEVWTEEEFANRTLQAISTSRMKAKAESSPSPDPDFELPREHHNMKSLIITRL